MRMDRSQMLKPSEQWTRMRYYEAPTRCFLSKFGSFPSKKSAWNSMPGVRPVQKHTNITCGGIPSSVRSRVDMFMHSATRSMKMRWTGEAATFWGRTTSHPFAPRRRKSRIGHAQYSRHRGTAPKTHGSFGSVATVSCSTWCGPSRELCSTSGRDVGHQNKCRSFLKRVIVASRGRRYRHTVCI